jgi:hypothetical protein
MVVLALAYPHSWCLFCHGTPVTRKTTKNRKQNRNRLYGMRLVELPFENEWWIFHSNIMLTDLVNCMFPFFFFFDFFIGCITCISRSDRMMN